MTEPEGLLIDFNFRHNGDCKLHSRVKLTAVNNAKAACNSVRSGPLANRNPKSLLASLPASWVRHRSKACARRKNWPTTKPQTGRLVVFRSRVTYCVPPPRVASTISFSFGSQNGILRARGEAQSRSSNGAQS